MAKNIPWQDRPEGCKDVVWRYSENPVIDRYSIPSSNSIFNSAVVPFGDGFAGVFRCDNKRVQMNIFAGFSKDGVNWEINHEPIVFKCGNTDMIESDYKYDPRVTWIEDRYWITWCNGYHGPTIGIAYTFDFKEFFQCENAFLPSTVTVFCSLKRLTASMRCFLVRATTVTLRLVTSTSAIARI